MKINSNKIINFIWMKMGKNPILSINRILKIMVIIF